MKLLNAFSLNMIPAFPATVAITELSLTEAQALAVNAESAIGHWETGAVFSTVLNTPVEVRRSTITLARGEQALVGQYRGPRLAEGAIELPAGATIQWLLVEIK